MYIQVLIVGLVRGVLNNGRAYIGVRLKHCLNENDGPFTNGLVSV